MTEHHEVPVKVNCWVDEGIAPLVEALNRFDGVWTLASCENDQSSFGLGAYVMFACRGVDPVQFATSVREFAPPPAELRVEQEAGEGDALLTLSCPPSQVPALARTLNAVRMTG